MADPNIIKQDALSLSKTAVEAKLGGETEVEEQKYLRQLLMENKENTLKLAESTLQQEQMASCTYTYGQPQEGEKEGVVESSKFNFTSKDQSFEFAKKLSDGIKNLGFESNIIDNGKGNYTVETTMPKGFEGQDPLKMDHETLKEAQKAAKNEESLDIMPFKKYGIPNDSDRSHRIALMEKYGNKRDVERARGGSESSGNYL